MFKKFWNWVTGKKPAQMQIDWAPGTLDNLKANTSTKYMLEPKPLPKTDPNKKPYLPFRSGSAIQSPLKIEESDNTPCTAASYLELETRVMQPWVPAGYVWNKSRGGYVKTKPPAPRAKKKSAKKSASKKKKVS